MYTRLTVISVLALALAAGCDKSDADGKKDDGKPAKADDGKAAAEGGDADAKEAEKPAAPTLEINEADWVEKDLKETSPLVNVTVKVPKDATLEKNGNGGVDIKIAPHYMITVGNLAVGAMPEALEWGESMTIKDSSFKDGKKVVEDENGFVFTYQMNDEANGHTYEPESHFVYFVEKDGAVYSFKDEKPLDAMMTPGSAYPEDLAKQVYGIVKASAKAT
jgi:hypothetical protein